MEDLINDPEDFHQKSDVALENAYAEIKVFFEEHKDDVFFSRQIEVLFEDKYFHWITNRALRSLFSSGVIVQDKRILNSGGEITIYWHKTLRYYTRPAKSLIALVNEYSDPNISAAIGIQGESLVLEGFARSRFVLEGRDTNENGSLQWVRSNHNLDFIFERDGARYGVEVKNTLGYMAYEEFKMKIELCNEIGVKPVFAARMLPRAWIKELNDSGGFALILKYQLYPWGFKQLAGKVAAELGLPVDTPRSLKDGTMKRFTDWHSNFV